ncbi:Rv3654c family TadE-like protein [Actinomyces sp. oral taxon 448]|uniref:Rv3654c family TadE-like protein n=1 Tax=Actinomyces sp. oral taxon 448 TaxID=712124 RepID=UPI000218A29C|nr:Rv3654c family TadE-like protein [Actinomyces sp. oral taxon 448]EGQ75257.1 membrane protein [Actinomyces sp. oral taxon 448 str. F0400]
MRGAVSGEDGAGTVLILGIIGVLLMAAVGVTGLVQAQAAAGRARTAADLAALGGATVLTSVVAPDEPCEVAGRVAQANGAEVTACSVAGEDVTVEVSVGARVLGAARSATSAARAGPVDEP